MDSMSMKQTFPVPTASSEAEGHFVNDMPAGTRDLKQSTDQEGHTTNMQPAGGRDVSVTSEAETHTTFTQP